MDTEEFASYALFLREDFDDLETGSGGLFKNFLAGVKRVLMEIVEGVVSRECEGAIKFIGEQLRRFIDVERFDERDRDEKGFCRKTAPAYVRACCVLRGVSATNVGIGMYLEHFEGTEEEKVFISGVPGLMVDCGEGSSLLGDESLGQNDCECGNQ